MDIDDDLIPDGVPDDAPDMPEDAGMHVLDVADTEPMDAVGELIEPDDPPDDAGQGADEPLAVDEASRLGATGEADIFASQDQASNIWGDVAEEPLPDLSGEFVNLLGATYSDFDFAGYDDLSATYGTPEYEMQFWDEQDEPNSCLIAVTSSMMNSMGIDMSEPLLTDFLEQEGIYDPMEGTVPANMADVINNLAVSTGTDVAAMPFYGMSNDDLENMLEHGKVQVSLNAAKLYSSAGADTLDARGFDSYSPHAVQLIGVEHTPDGEIAIINDPAVGPGLRIPMDVFDAARADLGCSGYMLSDSANMASLTSGFDTGEPEIRLGGMDDVLHRDPFGKVFKGDCLIPISYPGMPKPSIASFGSSTGWNLP